MKKARTLILISVEMMGVQMHSLQDLELALRQAQLHKSVVERPFDWGMECALAERRAGPLTGFFLFGSA